MNQPIPRISMIAALAGDSRAIGKDGGLIVRISDDLKRFKSLTLGHPIIMGRKTFESIGKALPGRKNFVITRNQSFQADGVVVCANLEAALERARIDELVSSNKTKEVFIIGGSEIYALGLPRANRLYLTVVQTDVVGDAFFPDYTDFKKIIQQEDRVDEKTGFSYSWIDLER